MASSSRQKVKPVFNPFSKKSTKKENGRQQALLALALVAASTAAWFLTPVSSIITSFILLSIPIHEDIELGVESWRQMRYKYPIVPDKWGVKAIGRELASKIVNSDSFCGKRLDFDQCKKQMRQYRWSFEVVSAPEVNAFALPGGIVRVTDSLLNRLNLSKGEIAGLLAHECGHVLHRHSQARVLKKNLVETVLKALVYEHGDDRQESFGEAVGEILLTGAKFIGEMKFSRKDEYEADDAAFDILASSNVYDPRAVKSLLEKLWSLNGGNGRSGQAGMMGFIEGWDRTHPGTEDRIEALAKRWNEMSSHERRKYNGLVR